MLVTLDGVRPDALARAKTPHFDELIDQGAYAEDALAVSPTLTLVNHASMVSGVTPARHKVTWNTLSPIHGKIRVPTLFTLAKGYGLRTAIFAGKTKLQHLDRKRDVDLFMMVGYDPEEVAAAVIQSIKARPADVMLVHFAEPDGAGHAFGWMSVQQLESIERCDKAFVKIVAALKDARMYERAAFIITSDHGGHDTTHGTDAREDMQIPWIAAGKGVPRGLRIKKPIFTYDTAATGADLLGLEVPGSWRWEGRSIFKGRGAMVRDQATGNRPGPQHP